MCMGPNLFFGMVASLAFLGLVRALTIDNELSLIKNDCYERLTIGQRLNTQTVYKSFDYNTLTDCQRACTEEKKACRAFSFGIGPKGNGTCELSADPIKETADLKPIGTVVDTDYDLYIKKLGCSVVIEKNPHTKPLPSNSSTLPGTETVPIDKYNSPQNGYEKWPHTSNSNNHYYLPPKEDEIHHVQSLVSVASGPQSFLHPVHDILVGTNPYEYGKLYGKKYYDENPHAGSCCEKPMKACCRRTDKPSFTIPPQFYYDDPPFEMPHAIQGCCGGDNRPHFGPPALNYPNKEVTHTKDCCGGNTRPPLRPVNYPYDTNPQFTLRPLNYPYNDYRQSHESRPEGSVPYPDYDIRRGDYNGLTFRYGESGPSNRPIGPVTRPDYDRYEEPGRPDPDRYGDRDRYGESGRPVANRPFGSAIRPNSDNYNDLLPNRPIIGPGRPISDRPSVPVMRPNGDNYDDLRPNRPNIDRYFDEPSRPSRPNFDRPTSENDIQPLPPKYDDYRPNGQNDGYPSYQYDKPQLPFPEPPSGNDKPTSSIPYPVPPDSYPDISNPDPNPPRPSSGGNGYDNVDKPDSSHRPQDLNDPNHGYTYDKPATWNEGAPDTQKGSNSKPIVSTSIGQNGQQITSIITEIKESCFRRVLAGKRVARRCVKRSLYCERIEDCQRECADEKHFICEGFNYRIDPTGRGKGECELLDVPLFQLDMSRDLYPDPNYDYYERDRNSASVKCNQRPSSSYRPYDEGYRNYGAGGNRYNRPYHGYIGGQSYPNGYYNDRNYDGSRRPYYKGDRPSSYDSGIRRPADTWSEDDLNKRRRPGPEIDRRYDNYRPNGDDYRPSGNRRGDYSYRHSQSQQDYENSHHYHNEQDRHDYHGNHRYSGIHYLPAHYYNRYYDDRYDHKQHGPYLPPKRPLSYEDNKNYYNNERDRFSWGSYGGSYGNFGKHSFGSYNQYNNRNRFDIDRRNYYLPPTKTEIPKDWGLYGGSYGTGGDYYQNSYGNQQSYSYYGFHKYGDPYNENHYANILPSKPSSYIPEPPGSDRYLPGGNYLPKPHTLGTYLPLPAKPSIYDGLYGHGTGPSDHFDNSLLPAEPRRPVTYDFIRDECSLRSAAGFRLHKGIVKKLFAVSNIYECELLCFKESSFPCQSYAFRYTIGPSDPTYNCYLSNKDYKELDHYTDLEPDRNYDIYTMNNKQMCENPAITKEDHSECFWRVRSGLRLAQNVVKDSLTTKSVVECQVECIQSTRFTCRAFSFRYGPRVIGGVIDNCQLTDCPYYELDPRSDFVPEPGFEIYERGSFGHGCEPYPSGINGKHKKDPGIKVDQLCYIGFGSPARLLPQATKKSLYVVTELDCKAECSKLRKGTLFQCMSFSYRSNGPKDLPNCQLSDILQRDLLPYVDYVSDPDSWLFAWDNYNSECISLANDPLPNNNPGQENGVFNRFDWDINHSLDTWKVYSVSGWPCRSLCKENTQGGFWYCELEGGDKNTWDYCCRPDHQCGASREYPYQWCYVGPIRTQWRKCSDKYYPYIHNIIQGSPNQYLPSSQTTSWSPFRPGARPERPAALPTESPPRPSLDDYEKLFEDEFLDPPKPGGFGQARHWPVSYLHQEMPPNNTDAEPRLMRLQKDNPKHEAIKKLINAIKNNDLQNIQYHISNDSDKADDILFVKIPLPTNFTQESPFNKKNVLASKSSINLEPVYSDEGNNIQAKRSYKSLGTTSTRIVGGHKETDYRPSWTDTSRPSSVYRRGFVTRTNRTTYP